MKTTTFDKARLSSLASEVRADTSARLLRNALSKTELKNLAFNPESQAKEHFMFSCDIKTMKATNQYSSGRCWIFAATNVLRERIAKEKNLENFELSQSYLAFWDKLERCNYFLTSIIETADLPTNDRTVSCILSEGVQDGGQWDMFVNIVNKYGIVPKSVMPDTYQASHTGTLGAQLNANLKRYAAILRSMVRNGEGEDDILSVKDDALAKIFRFLSSCYGNIPETFDFEYVTKDGKFGIEKGYTPQSFRDKYIGDMLGDYISIINAPTQDKPYDKLYTVKYLGNVVEATPIRYLNLEGEEFKALVAKQLTEGEVVWFGSDCGKYSERELNIWDDKVYEYDALTGLDTTLTKAEALDYGYSRMDHAMVITGVNLDEGKPTRWKVENSWGDTSANAGYYVASDGWFDRFVYQAVINKKYLGEKAALLDGELIELDPWDPMGSLAD